MTKVRLNNKLEVEINISVNIPKTKLIIACDPGGGTDYIDSDPFYVQVKDC